MQWLQFHCRYPWDLVLVGRRKRIVTARSANCSVFCLGCCCLYFAFSSGRISWSLLASTSTAGSDHLLSILRLHITWPVFLLDISWKSHGHLHLHSHDMHPSRSQMCSFSVFTMSLGSYCHPPTPSTLRSSVTSLWDTSSISFLQLNSAFCSIHMLGYPAVILTR